MRALDTSAAAEDVRIRLLRDAGGERRLAIACSMSEDVRLLSRAGIQRRHPEYTCADVDLALKRFLLGDQLFRVIWPDAALLAP